MADQFQHPEQRHTISKNQPLAESVSAIPMLLVRDYPEIARGIIRPDGGPIPQIHFPAIHEWNRLIALDQSPVFLTAELSGHDLSFIGRGIRTSIQDIRDRVIEALHAINAGRWKTANALSSEMEDVIQHFRSHANESAPALKSARLIVRMLEREPFLYLHQIDLRWRGLDILGDADDTPPEGVLSVGEEMPGKIDTSH